MAVSFLTSRVKKPDEDNWGEVKHVLSYLRGTRRLKLTLDITSLGITKMVYQRLTPCPLGLQRPWRGHIVSWKGGHLIVLQ